MKRIISVLAVMAIMAAMVAASAMPAFADHSPPPKNETAPNCEKGNTTAFFSRGMDNRNGQATDSLNKVFGEKCLSGPDE